MWDYGKRQEEEVTKVCLYVPVRFRYADRLSSCRTVTPAGSRVMRLPMGRERRVTSSPVTTASPPPALATARTAVIYFSSLLPVVMMLWASWEIEVAAAPV
ncbi:MAG: hypothetical protein MJ014_05455 [Methanocorpusculum sp.]|nr:hypothetical protein [Methanocorpusculum sp.]